MGLTASFLPKPVVGVNGSGMHTNISVSKENKNLFWDPKGEEKLSKFGYEFSTAFSLPATTSAWSSIPASTPIAASTRISKRRTSSKRLPSTAEP
jgi:glutamine synthetase